MKDQQQYTLRTTIDSTNDDIDCMIENFSTSDDISFISLSDVSGRVFFDNNLDAQVKSPTHQDDTMTISTYKVSSGEVLTQISRIITSW